MSIAEVRTWALKGAELRLVEIAEEAKAIFRAFPELRGKGRGFDGHSSTVTQRAKAPAGKRRKLSAEARQRISEAVKARWARQKGAGTDGGAATPETQESNRPAVIDGKPSTPAGKKGARGGRRGPRRMSPEARRRISAAAKARWAKVRAEKGGRAHTRAAKKK